MRRFDNADLLPLLHHSEVSVRMPALHFLSEGYAREEQILSHVFAAWDRWDVAQAYPEFPQLSHVPIPADQLPQACQRASVMVGGRKLTDTETRSAGKLIEQATRLPAPALQSHVRELSVTRETSKIFFRVDLVALQQRIDLIDVQADTLAQRLDGAIEALSAGTKDPTAFQEGMHALEALRRDHPEYMDMEKLLSRRPPSEGPGMVGFQMALQSLIDFEQPGLEGVLAPHVLDARQEVHTTALEALVRSGTVEAASALVELFPQADITNQRWIARGLQRLRSSGLAGEIAGLRTVVQDPAVWLMLLVAEVRQMDPLSHARLITDVPRVLIYSAGLIDALSVYIRIHESHSDARPLQQAFLTYVDQARQSIGK